MIREILQWALPIAVLVVAGISISRAEEIPLWQVVGAILVLVGLAWTLLRLIGWLY